MLLFLQAAAPATETVVEDGFSKLQVFLQQLIDWGVNAGGHIIGAVLIFIIGRFLIWHCPRFCVNRKLEDSSFILESCFQI